MRRSSSSLLLSEVVTPKELTVQTPFSAQRLSIEGSSVYVLRYGYLVPDRLNPPSTEQRWWLFNAAGDRQLHRLSRLNTTWNT